MPANCCALYLLVLSSCHGAARNQVPWVLVEGTQTFNATCEMQCSDSKAPDVSCGGTAGAFTVYVFKGKR